MFQMTLVSLQNASVFWSHVVYQSLEREVHKGEIDSGFTDQIIWILLHWVSQQDKRHKTLQQRSCKLKKILVL